MNSNRRKHIGRIFERLLDLSEELTVIKNDEQEAFDNIPESLKEGERAQESESSIDYLDEAIENCSSAIDALSEIIYRLKTPENK